MMTTRFKVSLPAPACGPHFAIWSDGRLRRCYSSRKALPLPYTQAKAILDRDERSAAALGVLPEGYVQASKDDFAEFFVPEIAKPEERSVANEPGFHSNGNWVQAFNRASYLRIPEPDSGRKMEFTGVEQVLHPGHFAMNLRDFQRILKDRRLRRRLWLRFAVAHHAELENLLAEHQLKV